MERGNRIGSKSIAILLVGLMLLQWLFMYPLPQAEAASATGLLDTSGWRITTTLDDGGSDYDEITAAMFDDDPATVWTSNELQTSWGLVLQIDMQTATEFDTIYIDSGDSPNYGRQYLVQTDADWNAQLAQTNGQSGMTKLALPKTTARLVNVWQTGASATPWTVADIRVYNGEAADPGDPDLGGDHPFGPNVYVMDPSMSAADINGIADSIFAVQERNEFGDERHAILFKPGEYDGVNVKVGFYTQVSGLGRNPDDVNINGAVNANADWNNGNALVNFWRAVENMAITPPSDTSAQWAVAQAAPMRRMHIKGQLELFDFDPWWNAGLASGGLLADSKVDGTIIPASQQQWFSRNNDYGGWSNGVWNMVFVGDRNAPSGVFPADPYTVVGQAPVIREKPYLYIDDEGEYQVFVPSLRRDAQGVSWQSGPTPGRSIPIDRFYIADPRQSTAASVNAALSEGKNVLFTPGIYHLEDTIRVNNPDTVVMGIGLATLIPAAGQEAMTVADVDGVIIASLLFDAAPEGSPSLLEVGPDGSSQDHATNPISLHDLFFRVGGSHAGKTDINLTINSDDVIGDHFWIWRADHGASAGGWSTNDSMNGLVVNGEDVTVYGLFNEHHNAYQTLWNGNGGRLYFYQSEIPYEVPDQASWMSHGGTVNGYSSYKVADTVTNHEAWGLGIYSYFRDADVKLHSAIEVPDVPGVRIHHATSVVLAGHGEITHVVNEVGASATTTSVRQTLAEYPLPDGEPEVETPLDRTDWVASAYKTSTADAAPSYAIDGNAGTRWANQEAQIPNANQWFQVDMGSAQAFDQIQIESGGDYARGYILQISNNGADWIDLQSGTGSATLTAAFDEQVARYIRIVQTGTANSNWWAIGEFNVLSKRASTAVTGVTVTPTTLTLKERHTVALSAVVAPANATNKTVGWTSSDPTIAAVDGSGNVTALREGSVTITATTADGGKQAQAAVTVIPGDPLPQPPSEKKGVASIKYLSTAPQKLTDLGIDWTYNWSVDYTGTLTGADFVPMVWGPGAVTNETIAALKQGRAAGRFDSLLGYNEPELAVQSNTSVADTIELWPRLMETGLRLGSPAVAYTYDDSYAPGKTWLDEFMTEMDEKSYPVDFIAIHFYPDFTDPDAVTKLRATLTSLHDKYGKPIWITEIGAIPFGSTYRSPTEALATGFLKRLSAMLEQLEFVERYAWFADNCDHDQACAYTTLYDSADRLTALGEGFRNPASIPDPEPEDGKLDRAGWSATASSTAFGADPSFAFDGDLGRQWSTEAGQTGGEWYLLDLGATYNVSALEFDSGANATFDYPRGYRIELSADGQQWTTVATGSGTAQRAKPEWDSGAARYVKITQTGYDGFWRWTLNELNVFGSSIQQGSTASASLSGPANAYPGAPFELTIGVKDQATPFTTFQAVLGYDPSAVRFDVVTNPDQTVSLAEGAVRSLQPNFHVLGTAVKEDLGQLMIIMASDQADAAIDGTVGLLAIDATVIEGSTAAVVPFTLTDVTVSYEGQSVDLPSATLQLSVTHVDRTELTAAIVQAKSLHDAAAEGSAVGQYPIGSKALLQAKIAAAEAVRDLAQASEQQLAHALSELQAAMTAFANAVITQTPIQTDKAALSSAIATAQSKLSAAREGSKVGQYPIDAIAGLRQAAQAAESVRGSSYATQAQVDQSVSALSQAMQTFSSRIVTLVPGQSQVTLADLSLLSKYYGLRSMDADWSKVQAADLFDSGEIDIRALAAIARMIINEWLNG